MKKVLALMLAMVLVLSLASCGGGDSTTTEPEVSKLSAENAISETPKHIYEDCEDNLARAKQNTYIMKDEVTEISDTYFSCGWSIYICLPTEELAKLNKGDEVAIIGKITDKKEGEDGDEYYMDEAELYDGEVPEPEVRESDINEGKLKNDNGIWKVFENNDSRITVNKWYAIYLADKNDKSKLRERATIRFTGDFVYNEHYVGGHYENVKIISVGDE